jgi:hypothetical protein
MVSVELGRQNEYRTLASDERLCHAYTLACRSAYREIFARPLPDEEESSSSSDSQSMDDDETEDYGECPPLELVIFPNVSAEFATFIKAEWSSSYQYYAYTPAELEAHAQDCAENHLMPISLD